MAYSCTSSTGREYTIELDEHPKAGDIIGPTGAREYVARVSGRSIYTHPGADRW